MSPDSPRLIAPRLLEVGSEKPVSCSLDGLFPAPEAGIYLELGDQRLNPYVTLEGDALMATATVTASAEQEGARQLVCTVTLGGESRETRENLTIYSFPAPLLNLSEPNAPEGKMVTVTCTAGARTLVTLEGIPAAVLGQPAQLQLNVTENDDRRGFFCEAILEVDGEILSKNESAELRVLYGPRLDDSDCPRSWTWPEGPEQTLRCEARGNPAPSVHCARPDGGARDKPRVSSVIWSFTSLYTVSCHHRTLGQGWGPAPSSSSLLLISSAQHGPPICPLTQLDPEGGRSGAFPRSVYQQSHAALPGEAK
uniref:Intercellular adhesion molecule 1/3/5 D2 domain-containing protein n=1 Tax=Spermophilus dauricus TaxID=99837 RepID=A0A8C9UVS5_SPEDA